MTQIIYTVQPGDTLYSIARLYGSTVQLIINANNIRNPNLIFPGSVILIPVEPGMIRYTVLPGDTIYRIAARFGTTSQSILNANPGLDPLRLIPGMVITITIPENAVAIYRGNPNRRMVSLTFDATYGDNQTYELLEILRNNNIKATFFLSGIWLINYPNLARAIANEGHEIGNHSYTHPHLPKITIPEVSSIKSC